VWGLLVWERRASPRRNQGRYPTTTGVLASGGTRGGVTTGTGAAATTTGISTATPTTKAIGTATAPGTLTAVRATAARAAPAGVRVAPVPAGKAGRVTTITGTDRTRRSVGQVGVTLVFGERLDAEVTAGFT
jgi:hypothetical protein